MTQGMCRTRDGTARGYESTAGPEPSEEDCHTHQCDADPECWCYNYDQTTKHCETFGRDTDERLTGYNYNSSSATYNCGEKIVVAGLNYVKDFKVMQPSFATHESAFAAFKEVDDSYPKVMFTANAYFGGSVWGT